MGGRFLTGLCGAAALAGPAQAQAPLIEPVADARPLVESFNETCRRGFPDLDAIRRHALATGWTERASRMIAERSDPRLAGGPAPHFLTRNGVMLSLMKPFGPFTRHDCAVTAEAGKGFDAAAFTAAVSAALNAGAPESVSEKKSERALWTVRPGIRVQTSLSTSGGIRTVSLGVHTAP